MTTHTNPFHPSAALLLDPVEREGVRILLQRLTPSSEDGRGVLLIKLPGVYMICVTQGLEVIPEHLGY